ncbi:hypothetical protein MA16_Dca009968 [Dendrobium catenatum]|uniref:Uncharacterized protein n=1 Tax=Dendrobium catenatum TaxID=906689 RepID=A0A2I0WDC5_9ASPA|nr:hypothetical protein MA16_Dca009968 [Dendrobium catenatum]
MKRWEPSPIRAVQSTVLGSSGWHGVVRWNEGAPSHDLSQTEIGVKIEVARDAFCP